MIATCCKKQICSRTARFAQVIHDIGAGWAEAKPPATRASCRAQNSLEQIPKLKSELQKLLDRLAFGATRINENGNVELLARLAERARNAGVGREAHSRGG
jgi:hypothetical protein